MSECEKNFAIYRGQIKFVDAIPTDFTEITKLQCIIPEWYKTYEQKDTELFKNPATKAELSRPPIPVPICYTIIKKLTSTQNLPLQQSTASAWGVRLKSILYGRFLSIFTTEFTIAKRGRFSVHYGPCCLRRQQTRTPPTSYISHQSTGQGHYTSRSVTHHSSRTTSAACKPSIRIEHISQAAAELRARPLRPHTVPLDTQTVVVLTVDVGLLYSRWPPIPRVLNTLPSYFQTFPSLLNFSVCHTLNGIL
jgi:hypothetical protein